MVSFIAKLKSRITGKAQPEHLGRGETSERAAKKFLQHAGLKFLTANFSSARGEIDLLFIEPIFSKIERQMKNFILDGQFQRAYPSCVHTK